MQDIKVPFTFLLIVEIVFTVCLWYMIPLSLIPKLFLILFVFALNVGIVLYTSWLLETKSKNTVITIITILFMFVVVPGMLVLQYFPQKQIYLNTCAGPGKILVKPSISVRCLYNNSLGSDISEKHYLNGMPFDEDSTLYMSCCKSYSLKTVITEYDSISDVGEDCETILWHSNYREFKPKREFLNTVTVHEKGGKRYPDAEAKFSVKYTFERVLPEDMNFWDVLFINENKDIPGLLTIIFGTDVIAIVVMFFMSLAKKKE